MLSQAPYSLKDEQPASHHLYLKLFFSLSKYRTYFHRLKSHKTYNQTNLITD